jgi:hypothetical protein
VAVFPTFVILMALTSVWDPTNTHYFVPPAVVSAPLLARLFRGRATSAAYLAVAALTIGLTLVHNQAAPLTSSEGRPWNLTQVQAFDVDYASWLGALVSAYQQDVPPHACVGAVLGTNEPNYLLYGPSLEHHVVYLSVDDAVSAAIGDELFYVVITTGVDRWAATSFAQAGWRVRSLGGYWLLASEPHATGGRCVA